MFFSCRPIAEIIGLPLVAKVDEIRAASWARRVSVGGSQAGQVFRRVDQHFEGARYRDDEGVRPRRARAGTGV